MGRAEDDEYRRRWAAFQPPSPGQVLAFAAVLAAMFWLFDRVLRR